MTEKSCVKIFSKFACQCQAWSLPSTCGIWQPCRLHVLLYIIQRQDSELQSSRLQSAVSPYLAFNSIRCSMYVIVGSGANNGHVPVVSNSSGTRKVYDASGNKIHLLNAWNQGLRVAWDWSPFSDLFYLLPQGQLVIFRLKLEKSCKD